MRYVDEDVERFLGEIDRQLAPHLEKALTRVANVEPLKAGVTHQILSGGKRIRAALCASSCELFGSPYARVLEFAAAIEHIQNFTLVHDDIADSEPQRRSRASIWKQHGIAHAVNIGDAFVPLAALSILQSPYADRLKARLLELISEYGLQMVEGQTFDINLRGNDAVGFEEYFACTSKKTGAFLAMATVGGGMIGGANDAELVPLREFALLAGVAFQVRDDLLDMEGGKGRARGSDVLEGKRTLMVVHAAQHVSGDERRRLYEILEKSRAATSPEDVEWVWRLYRRTGADEYAEQTAARLIDEACEHILALPDTEAKYRLLRLAKYLSTRRR